MPRLFLSALVVLIVVLCLGCQLGPSNDEINSTVEAAIEMTNEAQFSSALDNQAIATNATQAVPTEEPTKTLEAIRTSPTLEAVEATSPPTSIELDEPDISLFPLSYTLTDAGGGWNDGFVEIYFANTTDDIFFFDGNFISGIVVETKEGATYPGKYRRSRPFGLTSWPEESSLGPFYPQPILPATRFTAVSTERDKIRYAISWQSAVAATPTRIKVYRRVIVPDAVGPGAQIVQLPELTVDLASYEGAQVSFPFMSDRASIATVESLRGTILPLGSPQLSATFTGNCFISETYLGSFSYELEFVVENADQFQEARGETLLDTVLYTSGGSYSHSPNMPSSQFYGQEGATGRTLVLGPNQAATGTMTVGTVWIDHANEVTYIGLLWPDGDYTILETTECQDAVQVSSPEEDLTPTTEEVSTNEASTTEEMQLEQAILEGSIWVLLPDNASSARWETDDRRFFEQAFEAAGVEYNIVNAEGDARMQQTHAEQAITAGAKVIVLVNLDSGSGAAIIAAARNSGLTVIDYDILTTEGPGADIYVGFTDLAENSDVAVPQIEAEANAAAAVAVAVLRGENISELTGGLTTNNGSNDIPFVAVSAIEE